MPDWIILLFVIWGVSMFVGRSRGCRRRSRRWDRWWYDEDEPTTSISSGPLRNESRRVRESGAGMWAARRDPVRGRRSAQLMRRSMQRPAESPMQSLQRRFVDGSLTVDEYERELDRLLRKG